jgi:hypothetical protein
MASVPTTTLSEFRAQVSDTKSRRSSSKTQKIKKIASSLARKGAMTNINKGLSVDFICAEIINANQSHVVEGKQGRKNYSLLESESDSETIKNENILDRSSYEKITNRAQLAEGRFSNQDDPFYNLDDGLSNRLKTKRNKTQQNNYPDLIQIALDMNR